MNMGLWIAIGVGVGAAIGTAMNDLPIGVAIGIAIGAAMGGLSMATQRKHEPPRGGPNDENSSQNSG